MCRISSVEDQEKAVEQSRNVACLLQADSCLEAYPKAQLAAVVAYAVGQRTVDYDLNLLPHCWTWSLRVDSLDRAPSYQVVVGLIALRIPAGQRIQ